MEQPPKMPLSVLVDAVFADGGALAQAHGDYFPRQAQLQMAHAVAHAIKASQALVVEAGTGIGKTYAYLVPALCSGKTTIISTATKALQDQLCERDIPALTRALQLPIRLSVLKGRSSYLCQLRLEQAWQRLPAGDRFLAAQLNQVEQWSRSTSNGDLSDIPGLDERSQVMPWVTSTADNCVGSPCSHWSSCHVNKARRDAQSAQVVVVNHHLFLADANLRDGSANGLIPHADVVVFDEAHLLLETSLSMLGDSFSPSRCMQWANDLAQWGLQEARGWLDWPGVAQRIIHAAQGLQSAFMPSADGTSRRIPWSGPAPQGVDDVAWTNLCDALAQVLDQTLQSLRSIEESNADLIRHREALEDWIRRWQSISHAEEDGDARWVECGSQIRFQRMSPDISRVFREKVLRLDESADTTSWIFTSATLDTGHDLSGFKAALGLNESRALRLDSPFDYPHQAALFIPPDLPLPADPQHGARLADWIWPHVLRLGGRTMVLTTTLNAVDLIGSQLQRLSRHDVGPQVLLQGQLSKRELLAAFRRASDGAGTGAVLVASASFWEGVDLPGDTLQMLVIDKLPFPPPDDPWVRARSHHIEASGGSSFKSIFLAEAALALKQGAGRLIRSETDQGLLVIGDVRLLRMPYGKSLLRALPPMRRLETEDQVRDWVTELVTISSTRGLPW